MEKYFSVDNVQPLDNSVVTIGTYDGLHRGHQEIIKHLVSISQTKEVPSVVITFDPHPRHILNNEVMPLPLIMSLDKKLNLLAELQVDQVLVIPFDIEFSKITAEEFLKYIVMSKFYPEQIVVGFDHHFGNQRSGSPESLTSFCENNNIKLDIISPITDEGLKISSTGIRKLITDGYVRRASFELGWVFGFRAKVVHGVGRGHSLDYPTANIIPQEKNQLLPKPGVYLTRGRVNGQQLYGMCNFGVRPTFGEKDLIMEVHFFNPKITDLYDHVVFVEFLERIRDEKKFKSINDLKEQLSKDENKCKDLLGKYK